MKFNIKEKLLSTYNDQYHRLKKKEHSLRILAVEATEKCNLQCRHCYMHSVQESSKKELTFNKWKSFFDDFKSKFGTNIIIDIRGGEPFIRDDIYQLIEYIYKLGFRLIITTNGLLLDKDKIIFLNKCIKEIAVSLDGFEESHNFLRNANTYNQALNAIKLIKRFSTIPLTVKTTVYRKNINELERLYNFFSDLSVDRWHFFTMEPLGRGAENTRDLKILFEEQFFTFFKYKARDFYKHKKCGAGINFCFIKSNGDIVKCAQENMPKVNIYGNILVDDFRAI